MIWFEVFPVSIRCGRYLERPDPGSGSLGLWPPGAQHAVSVTGQASTVTALPIKKISLLMGQFFPGRIVDPKILFLREKICGSGVGQTPVL